MSKKNKEKNSKNPHIDFDPKLDKESSSDIQESPLSVQQRLKRAKVMRRTNPRLQQKRKLVLKRAAKMTQLKGRAKKSSIGTLKDRFSGGKSAGDRTYADKARLERIVSKKKNLVGRLTRHNIKFKRALDIKRKSATVKESTILDRLEGTKALVRKYKKDSPGEQIESFDFNLSLLENFDFQDGDFIDFMEQAWKPKPKSRSISMNLNDRNKIKKSGLPTPHKNAVASMHYMVLSKGDRHTTHHYAQEVSKVLDSNISRHDIHKNYHKVFGTN